MSSVFKLLATQSLLWSFISLSLLSSALLINQAAAARSRSPLRADNGGGNHPDFAVDLNATNFDVVLKNTPANYAIVEFYAHWCPACRNFKPQYEKVASLFNGADAVHPGIVLMTRVDCANKANTNLCDKFSINHYPMLFWGPSSRFVAGSWDWKHKNINDIHPIDDGRTSERMLKWINNQLESSYSFEDEKYHGNEEVLQSNVSDPAGQLQL